MARGRSELDDFVYYMVLFGGAYVIYRLALAGKLGSQLQQSAQTFHDVLVGPPQTLTGPISAPLQQILAVNPNFVKQAIEWRRARCQDGEDFDNYAAFRRHLLGIGAPVPDPSPPPEWPDRFGGPKPC